MTSDQVHETYQDAKFLVQLFCEHERVSYIGILKNDSLSHKCRSVNVTNVNACSHTHNMLTHSTHIRNHVEEAHAGVVHDIMVRSVSQALVFTVTIFFLSK